MVTVLRTGKGHEVAAEAVQRLTPEFPNLRLLVLGEGPDRGEVERALANLGARAIMTGHREDVLAVLDAVDVLIHPTRADAFPTALLESMAASVPAIATSVGGIPEIITDGETGLLIDSPPDGRALTESLAVLLRDARARNVSAARPVSASRRSSRSTRGSAGSCRSTTSRSPALAEAASGRAQRPRPRRRCTARTRGTNPVVARHTGEPTRMRNGRVM